VDFELSEEQKLLLDQVRNFVRNSSPVERLRRLREDEVGWQKETWKQMGELGWLGVAFPEDVGGMGLSFVEAALILQELGTTLVPEPFIPSVVLGGLLLQNLGSKEQRQAYLAPMIAGDTSLALAYAEVDARHALSYQSTRATSDGDDYVLEGEKRWVLNGHAADHLLVSARTSGEADDEKGLSVFVVPRNTPGVQIVRVQCMDGHKAAMVSLAGARVPKASLLGQEGMALPSLEQVLDYAAAAACAEGSGLVQRTLEMTRQYLTERKQFGAVIGTFQALQHRAVDMFVEVELCKSTAIHAMLRVDADSVEARIRAVSTAKAQLSSGGGFVTRQAIQLHGGIGVTDEHDVGLYFKRHHVLSSLFGDEQYHVDRFGRMPSFENG